MAKHWSEKLSCQCGKTFRSMSAESMHRHNFPRWCRQPKEARPVKRCGTCRFFEPTEDSAGRPRAIKDRRYPCTFPVPLMPVMSIVAERVFRGSYLDMPPRWPEQNAMRVDSDDGTTCKTYEPRPKKVKANG